MIFITYVISHISIPAEKLKYIRHINFLCLLTLLAFTPSRASSQVFTGLYDSLVAHFQDTLFSTLSAKDYLYSGIDNTFIILKQIPVKQVHIDTFDSTHIEFEGGKLVLQCQKPENGQRLLVKLLDSASRCIYSKILIIKSLPHADIFIGHCNITASMQMNKNEVMSADSLYLFYGNWIANNNSWTRIKKYSLGYNYGNYYISKETTGNRLETAPRRLLLGARPGQDIGMTLSIESAGNIERETNTLHFRIY